MGEYADRRLGTHYLSKGQTAIPHFRPMVIRYDVHVRCKVCCYLWIEVGREQ